MSKPNLACRGHRFASSADTCEPSFPMELVILFMVSTHFWGFQTSSYHFGVFGLNHQCRRCPEFSPAFLLGHSSPRFWCNYIPCISGNSALGTIRKGEQDSILSPWTEKVLKIPVAIFFPKAGKVPFFPVLWQLQHSAWNLHLLLSGTGNKPSSGPEDASYWLVLRRISPQALLGHKMCTKRVIKGPPGRASYKLGTQTARVPV